MAQFRRVLTCCLIAFAGAFLIVSPTHSQTAPAGWTLVSNTQGWSATSPDQGGGLRVRMYFYPVVRNNQSIDAWVVSESLRRVTPMGRVVWTQTGLTRDTNLVGVSRTIMDARNVRTGVFSWVWETPRGRQMAIVTLPLSLTTNNSAYAAAQESWGNAWLQRLSYAPGQPPPAVAQQPPPQQQQQQSSQTADAPPPGGRNCRREPIWGFRRSVFCQPSGICPDREIRGYEWVCD